MDAAELSISELAHEAGLSRRAVRFYVQQGLLPPPEGRGRGSHYRPEHLGRLRQILELQQAGHSLEAIRKILQGGHAPIAERPDRQAVRPRISAELWTRLKLLDGVELHFNAARFSPDAAKLIELREIIRHAFKSAEDGSGQDDFGENPTSQQEPT